MIIMRKPNETDQQYEKRIQEAAKLPGYPPTSPEWLQLVKEDEEREKKESDVDPEEV